MSNSLLDTRLVDSTRSEYTSLSALYQPEFNDSEEEEAAKDWFWFGLDAKDECEEEEKVENRTARVNRLKKYVSIVNSIGSATLIFNLVCAIVFEFIVVVSPDSHLLTGCILLAFLVLFNFPLLAYSYFKVFGKIQNVSDEESFCAFLDEGDFKASVLFWNMNSQDRLLIILKNFLPYIMIINPLIMILWLVSVNIFQSLVNPVISSCLVIGILFLSAAAFTLFQQNFISKSERFRKAQMI
jgi:hypothetical protein